MQNMYQTSEGNFISFYYDAVKNRASSNEKGRPIFDKALFLRIVSPGQPKSEVVYEVEKERDGGGVVKNESIHARFGEYIERFKKNDGGGDISGTPIDQWPQIDVKTAATLKALGIYNVEALAVVADSALPNIGMGARELRAKAQAFLDAAEGSAGYEKLAAENESLRSQIENLQKQISELGKKRTVKKKK